MVEVKEREMWNLEGERIEGFYLSGDVKVRGVVTLSRVTYGGEVTHHVVLDKGFSWKNGAVKRDAGETVIVDHKYVTRVMSAA